MSEDEAEENEAEEDEAEEDEAEEDGAEEDEAEEDIPAQTEEDEDEEERVVMRRPRRGRAQYIDDRAENDGSEDEEEEEDDGEDLRDLINDEEMGDQTAEGHVALDRTREEQEEADCDFEDDNAALAYMRTELLRRPSRVGANDNADRPVDPPSPARVPNVVRRPHRAPASSEQNAEARRRQAELDLLEQEDRERERLEEEPLWDREAEENYGIEEQPIENPLGDQYISDVAGIADLSHEADLRQPFACEEDEYGDDYSVLGLEAAQELFHAENGTVCCGPLRLEGSGGQLPAGLAGQALRVYTASDDQTHLCGTVNVRFILLDNLPRLTPAGNIPIRLAREGCTHAVRHPKGPVHRFAQDPANLAHSELFDLQFHKCTLLQFVYAVDEVSGAFCHKVRPLIRSHYQHDTPQFYYVSQWFYQVYDLVIRAFNDSGDDATVTLYGVSVTKNAAPVTQRPQSPTTWAVSYVLQRIVNSLERAKVALWELQTQQEQEPTHEEDRPRVEFALVNSM